MTSFQYVIGAIILAILYALYWWGAKCIEGLFDSEIGIKLEMKERYIMRKALKHYHIVELLKNKNGRWYWRLKYNNGSVLAHSETYSSKSKARRTARNLAAKIILCVYKES